MSAKDARRTPVNPTRVFIRLKLRLLLNGSRRARSSVWATISFYLSLVNSLVAAVAGAGLGLFLRAFFEAHVQHRVLVLGTFFIVVGWWFGPLISGGVDETIDPARLVLLPLTRSQIRRGQIAAGFIGQAPAVVVIWVLGLIGGLTRSPWSAVLVTINGVVVLLAALVGSRALSTTLARLSRSRAGGDFAAVVAVVGGAALFAALQLGRFVSGATLDKAAGILRWTPPGLAGEAFEFGSQGQLAPMAWRTATLAAVVVVCAWWWSNQLDRLLVEPARIGGVARSVESSDRLAIFSGIRRRLPRTPSGAAVAREIVYLVRSPGRRAALLAGTILGLVYLALFAVYPESSSRTAVLFAPVAMVMSLPFAANQLGIDAGCFWIEVAIGADSKARWWGRQLLGAFATYLPVGIAAVAIAVWTGGWVEFLIVNICFSCSLMTLIGVGSLLSPYLVTPVPDSGNPFGNKQSMQGAGCATALLNMGYLGLIGVLLVPSEWLLTSVVRDGHLVIAVLVVVLIAIANWLVWRFTTNMARRDLPLQESDVLKRLDARLNA